MKLTRSFNTILPSPTAVCGFSALSIHQCLGECVRVLLRYCQIPRVFCGYFVNLNYIRQINRSIPTSRYFSKSLAIKDWLFR